MNCRPIFIFLLVFLHKIICYFLKLHKIFDKFANSSSVSASPLTLAPFPRRSIDSSISSFVKSSSAEFFSPLASVFLLWLNDARMIRNISRSFSTLTGGSSYRSSRITADPTFGRGIKQFGGTLATIYGFA